MKRGEQGARCSLAGQPGRMAETMAFLRIFIAVLGLALAGAAVGMALFWWTSRPSDVQRDPIPVTFGGAAFLIPPAFVRAGALPRPGPQERVDLAMIADGLRPPQPGGPAPDFFVSIQRQDGVVDPSERVDQIYGRFLEPDIWQNPGGLLLRRFAQDSPYADEELFISPPDGRAFTARCRKPLPASQARGGDIGEACLWRFRQGGADVQVRFGPGFLPQWEDLSGSLRAKLAGWQR
jgi:hypothetical protein